MKSYFLSVVVFILACKLLMSCFSVIYADRFNYIGVFLCCWICCTPITVQFACLSSLWRWVSYSHLGWILWNLSWVVTKNMALSTVYLFFTMWLWAFLCICHCILVQSITSFDVLKNSAGLTMSMVSTKLVGT